MAGNCGQQLVPRRLGRPSIMHEISNGADPAARDNAGFRAGGPLSLGCEAVARSVSVIVDSQTGEVITGYPTNLPSDP